MLPLKFINKHPLLALYSAVFALLLLGLGVTSGGDHLLDMTLYFGAFLMVYFVVKRQLVRVFNSSAIKAVITSNSILKTSRLVLIGVGVVGMIGHLLYLGNLPAWSALKELRMSQVIAIRADIVSQSHWFWNYLASFNVKAILPFTLLLLLVKGGQQKVAFWVVLFLGVTYATCLMQKSYILFMLMPIILYSVQRKKITRVLIYGAMVVTVVVSLTWIANPAMRGGVNDTSLVSEQPIENRGKAHSGPVGIVLGLTHRVLIVPGEIVSEWFTHVPKNKPYLYGNGYRMWANISGRTYHPYAQELYPLIRPEYAERGLTGSVNVASFMYEYANFGRLGLLLSAAFLAMLLVFIEIIFGADTKSLLALNTFPVFMLSSGAITTTLFSGGWMLSLLLYFLFKKEFSSSKK